MLFKGFDKSMEEIAWLSVIVKDWTNDSGYGFQSSITERGYKSTIFSKERAV